jgi:hypothetical protein
MPAASGFLVLGLLAAVVGIIPLPIAFRIARRIRVRIGAHTMVAVLVAQMVGFFWMIITISVVYLKARAMLVWYAFPAVVLLVVLNITLSLLLVRRNRG